MGAAGWLWSSRAGCRLRGRKSCRGGWYGWAHAPEEEQGEDRHCCRRLAPLAAPPHRTLESGVHMVSGTPGRVFDMIKRRSLRTRCAGQAGNCAEAGAGGGVQRLNGERRWRCQWRQAAAGSANGRGRPLHPAPLSQQGIWLARRIALRLLALSLPFPHLAV